MGSLPVKEVLMINVSGKDRPGVTSAVTNVLSRFDSTLLDIGQAVIHDQLNMGILAAVPSDIQTSQVVKEVSLTLKSMDMQVKFLPISHERYDNWVAQQGKQRHIVTLLARNIEASHLAAITDVTSQQGLNIDKIVRLSGRLGLNQSEQLGLACIELSARG